MRNGDCKLLAELDPKDVEEIDNGLDWKWVFSVWFKPLHKQLVHRSQENQQDQSHEQERWAEMEPVAQKHKWLIVKHFDLLPPLVAEYLKEIKWIEEDTSSQANLDSAIHPGLPNYSMLVPEQEDEPKPTELICGKYAPK